MKNIFSLLTIIIACLFFSCTPKNKEEKVTDQKKTADTTNVQVKDPSIPTIGEKKTEELEKLTPLTEDEMKKLAPQEIMGAPQTDITVNSTMGTGMVNATYQLPNSGDVSLTIFDCAGPGGAGLYNVQYLALIDINNTDSEARNKTINFGNGKAIVNCERNDKDCSFTYFKDGRFLVIIESKQADLEVLKQIASNLKLK